MHWAKVTCLLCNSDQIRLLDTLAPRKLVAAWQERFRIDVSRELNGLAAIELYECAQCHLQFFYPAAAGSSAVYQELESLDWYYLTGKWEHDVALEDIPADADVLEIGCGRGEFIERLGLKTAGRVRGIELNKNAVAAAQAKGLPVSETDLHEIAGDAKEEFDVVCCFQVLEHIAQPFEFLQLCTQLLKPGGRLIVSVPNREGFLRLARNELLDQPPHHVSRWSKAVFEWIRSSLKLGIERVREEPLADYHADWYMDLQFGRFVYVPGVTGLYYRFCRSIALPLIKALRVHKLIRGHTLYTCLRKPQ